MAIALAVVMIACSGLLVNVLSYLGCFSGITVNATGTVYSSETTVDVEDLKKGDILQESLTIKLKNPGEPFGKQYSYLLLFNVDTNCGSNISSNVLLDHETQSYKVPGYDFIVSDITLISDTEESANYQVTIDYYPCADVTEIPQYYGTFFAGWFTDIDYKTPYTASTGCAIPNSKRFKNL